ncbi:MAG: DUF3823 domain-containing protein [Chitinophagaceae bacterium]
MKINIHYIIIIAFVAVLTSCKKDNYDAPSSLLNGKIVYKGEAIQLEYNQVPFEVYQPGFGKVGPIGSGNNQASTFFAPEGTYSLLLFDGDYKIVVRPGQGPFIWKQTGGKADTVLVSLRGNQTLDLEVTPYYMVRTPAMAVSGRVVTGTFKLEKIVTDVNAKDVERVSLYTNKTMFVSKADNNAVIDMAGSAITDMNNIKLSVTVPAIVPAQNYVYARIGVKVAGVEDMIFSPVTKVTF